MTASRSVVYRIQADVKGAQANIAALGASMHKLGDDMTGATKQGIALRQGLDTLGGAAGKVGLVAAAGLGASIKAAVDWESAWAGVTKTVDGSASQMAELEAGLRSLARELPASHAEIAAVAEAAGQLGVARPAILDFTKTMIDLGETTNLSADQAATSIAQIQNVMGTAPRDVDNFASALVALGNAGASTESQILDMTQRIAGAGAQIGLAETDILAIANAAASMGIEAEAGGSAISSAFTKIAVATKRGGDDLETFAKTAGMTGEEFVKAFETDPARAFAAFTKGLDGVKRSGGDVFSLLKDLGLSDIRVSQALLGMAASGDMLTESLDLGSQAWEENNALTQEAEKRYDTMSAQGQKALNSIADSAIDFGEVALPVLATTAEHVADVAQWFGDLPQPVQTAGTAVAAFTAVAGGGLWVFSKTVQGIASTREALGQLSVSAAGTRSKLGAVTGFLGGPWGIALAAGAVGVGAFAKSQADAKANVDALRGSLNQQTGALTGNTRAMLAKSLEDEGVLQKARDLGLNLKTVTDAAAGNTKAMATLKAEQQRLSDTMEGRLTPAQSKAYYGFQSVMDAVGGQNQAVREAQASISRLSEAMSQLDGKSVNTFVTTTFRTVGSSPGFGPQEHAAGGYVASRGPGTLPDILTEREKEEVAA